MSPSTPSSRSSRSSRSTRANRRSARSLTASLGVAAAVVVIVLPLAAPAQLLPRLDPPAPGPTDAEPTTEPTPNATPPDGAQPGLTDTGYTDVSGLAGNDTAEQAEVTGTLLDVAAMLSSAELWPGGDGLAAVEGTIWSLPPRPGYRLVQVPLVLDPARPGTLGEPPIAPAGGQFLAYHIVPGDSADADAAGDAAGGGGASVFGGTSSTASVSPPPLLTRALAVTREGRLQWEMDRNIPGATAREGGGAGDNLYLLKLRPERLRALQPERPVPQAADAGSGVDPRLLAQGRRDAEIAYRQAQIEYRDLASRVRALPDRFTIAMPPRVWAVYQVRERDRTLTFEGAPPLPWSLEFDQLTSLREAMASGGGGAWNTSGVGEAADPPALATVERLIARGTPLDLEVATLWASTLELPAQVRRGDRGYRVLESLLKVEQGDVARQTLAALLAVQPPTPASLALLASMESKMAPGQRLETLAMMLGADVDEGGSATESGDEAVTQQQMDTRRDRVDAIARLLGDPSAPPPADVLDRVARALEPQPGAQGAVIHAIDLAALPPDRRDGVIDWVARGAGSETMATMWLRERMLTADADPATRLAVLRALAMGGRADGSTPAAPREERATPAAMPEGADGSTPAAASRQGGSLIGEAVGGVEMTGTLANMGGGSVGGAAKKLTKDMIDSGFQPVTRAGEGADGLTPAASGGSDGDDPPAEPQPIPLQSMDDPMFDLIRSDEPETRAVAWAALLRFAIAADFEYPPDPAEDPAADPGASPPPLSQQARPRDPYAAVIAAGRAMDPAPPQLVPFLDRQPDVAKVTLGLIQLVVVADDATAEAAGQALLGSNRPIESAMVEVIPNERAIFAARLYTPPTPDAPTITALLRDPDLSDKLMTWFAQSVAKGELPPVAAWVQAMGGRAETLAAAASPNPAVAAAALEALVASLNGDDALRREVQTKFADALSREGGERVDRVRQAWSEIEEARTIQQLASRAGRYRLILTARDPQQPAGFLGRPEARVRESQLAVVDLEVDGRQPRLGGDVLPLTLAEEELALRIVPSELKNFNNELATSLPLTQAAEPLDLRPQPNGSWRGQTTLPDGVTIELRMEPAT